MLRTTERPPTAVGVHLDRRPFPETVAPDPGGLPRALVLNASREPLCVVGVHRAVALVLNGKAVVLESDGHVLRSERMQLPVPHVLCLTRYVHVPYRRSVTPTRRAVLARDGHRCAYCAGSADTVDHVHPRSRGGQHVWTNVVAACSRCNHRKADRLLSEIGWTLLQPPADPRGSAALLAAAVRPHPSWAAYLVA
ncbi:HNH endonuclease [Actinotalea sp. AC32]|nr:HNH endonuclease [Actinotalea sp. AC32]